MVLGKIKDEDNNKVYQGAVLKDFDASKAYCKQQALADLSRLGVYNADPTAYCH